MITAFSKIKCFVFDVDGVLTNGNVMVMPGGILVRAMSIKDGYAIQLAIKKGYAVWVISGGHSEEVKLRLQNLGVKEVFMKVVDKRAQLEALSVTSGIALEDILYMGDDMPDLDAMKIVGMATCPNDAVPEIKLIAKYIALAKGGEGCAREVIEKTLKCNNHWDTKDQIASK